MSAKSFDALVVGGGPGGLACALELRRKYGLSVAVVDGRCTERTRPGQSLCSAARPILESLDAWTVFQGLGLSPSPPTTAAWGTSDLEAQDHLTTPSGRGWLLQGSGFDRLLSELAREAGVLCLGERDVVDPCFEEGRWITAVGEEGAIRISARFLIDATGRSARVARQLGASLHVLDRQVALVATVQTSAVPEPSTLIETFPEGWCYSVPAPDRTLFVALLTDSDLARTMEFSDPTRWLGFLKSLPHTGARVANAATPHAIRSAPAHSSRLNRFHGTDWIAVGDAAAAYDPLAGGGIVRALDSGIRAARAVHEKLAHERSEELAEYQAYMTIQFERYAKSRRTTFQSEPRFQTATYWQRRHGVMALDPLITLTHVASAPLPPCPADLLDIDFRLLLESAERPLPAYQIVSAHLAKRHNDPENVILALQWLVTNGALRSA